LTVGDSSFDSTAGHPDGETTWMMISAVSVM
jgi:hypothetical protein